MAKKSTPKKTASAPKKSATSAAKEKVIPANGKSTQTKSTAKNAGEKENIKPVDNTVQSLPKDRLKHPTSAAKGPVQGFTNPFKTVKTKEEAVGLRERLIKTGSTPQPSSCSAVIVNTNFDDKQQKIIAATVKHYDEVKMAWSDLIEIDEEALDNYHS